MSLHRSLKTEPGAINQHRNVLTRAERITRLQEQERFDPEADSPLGLVKVINRAAAKKKKPPKTEEGAAEAAGEPTKEAAGSKP